MKVIILVKEWIGNNYQTAWVEIGGDCTVVEQILKVLRETKELTID